METHSKACMSLTEFYGYSYHIRSIVEHGAMNVEESFEALCLDGDKKIMR